MLGIILKLIKKEGGNGKVFIFKSSLKSGLTQLVETSECDHVTIQEERKMAEATFLFILTLIFVRIMELINSPMSRGNENPGHRKTIID